MDDYRFDDLRGDVRWIPEALEVHDASARVYGGTADFEYAMAPLGIRGTPAVNRFDATYRNLDLTTLSDAFELQGIRLAGSLSGRNLLEWPSGRFAQRQGGGEMRFTPPAGTELMTRMDPGVTRDSGPGAPDSGAGPEGAELAAAPEVGPFSPHTPLEPVPIGGSLAYQFGPEWVDIGPSRIATESTYVEFAGRTAYGERSEIPFHVSSADWQDSDRIFAGC